ncbi:peptidoglycan recognition protein family protein [Corynebacterium rouxii]|uniref:N-acetylmuramoyl-L-alanine amidase n=1 Tax=Corynebacterium rouxii TaxID=2719119 RepID=A0ABU3PPA2_9CORY|nr:N-acetylmuramoyl-L-alanine amidase [Corynebacterium rouxii]MDT9411299.1 N-acetylmuramoyl-L-alanine amidase [Corynebacterium rouxii]
MKDWAQVLPDNVRLLAKHYTPGRSGRNIKHVTIHHMAMIGGINECWNVWQSRPASGHYAVGPDGSVGQLVWDRDTAWGNANLISNQETIIIEHSNSGGPSQDWPIGEQTLEAGAHLVAALCRFYNLGRPVSGRNVRFHHIESGGLTSCPYHLRPGHRYHDHYIARAQFWYDHMTKPASPSHIEENIFMALSSDEQRELLAKTRDIWNALRAPEPSRVEGSIYEAPLTEYIMQTDRKVEELHVAYAGQASAVQKALDALAEESAKHDPAEEVHDHA